MAGELGERFREIEDEDKWLNIFNKIRTDSAKSSAKLPLKAAKSVQNARLNRYRDVLPFDHSRVVLPSGSYINASHVSVSYANRDYILTQGPLPETAEHFWEMVWCQNSRAIIMLNKVFEKNQVKCHQYFPVASVSNNEEPGLNNSEHHVTFGDFEIWVEEENSRNENYCVRWMVLKNRKNDEQRSIMHFQFNTWPDFGVPDSTRAFLEFLAEVKKANVLKHTNFGPPIIHCSAGIGRSGTFIIADVVLCMARTTDLAKIDIVKLVTELRHFRMGLIQTDDQLRFCWKAIVDALDSNQWREIFLTPDLDLSPPKSTNNNNIGPRPDFKRSSALQPTKNDDDEDVESTSSANTDFGAQSEAIRASLVAFGAAASSSESSRRRDASPSVEQMSSGNVKRRKSSATISTDSGSGDGPGADKSNAVLAFGLQHLSTPSKDGCRVMKKKPSTQDDESLCR